MAKVVQLSDDDGVTWYDLPGNSGEFTLEAGSIDDTIFGQTYQSNEAGLIGWSVNANGLYKGFAGYVATVKQSGTTTAMTSESMTLESGKIYKIDDTAKEIWDRGVAFTVEDGMSDVTAEVEWFDILFGRLKFQDSYTVLGSISITGNYFPTTALGKANSFDLTQTADTIETSDFATVQANNGYRTFQPGLRTVSVDLTGFYDVTSGFRAALDARSEVIVEINPDGNNKSIARGFFRPLTEGQSGDVGALEEETTSFGLNVPFGTLTAQGATVLRPFGWFNDATTTLAQAIRVALVAFENETEIDVQYLYDGTNGVTGDCIVTDVSLAGGLEVMNDFTINVQGTGDTTDVGTG